MATYDYDYIEKTDVIEAEVITPRGTIVLGIDFNDGTALMANADLKRVNGAEALLQRIIKFLRTEKDLYRLYNAENNESGTVFGFSIFETIGYTYTSVVLSKYSAEIRNFLQSEYDVESVDSIRLQPVEDNILISLYVTSTYGKIEIKEVIQENYYLYGKGA